jgi:SNF2 family DNA or RNA helicase
MGPADHQKEMVEIFRGRNYFGAWHDCGTMKTSSVIYCYNDKSNIEQKELLTLIFCPKNVLENWKVQFQQWGGKGDQVLILTGPDLKRTDLLLDSIKNKTHNIFVTNYEALSMKKFYKTIFELTWELLVVDEIHNFKGPTNVRTKLLHALGDKAKNRIGLTGSLVLNSYEDIWSPLRFLEKGLVGANFYAWQKKYFYNANAGKSWLNFPDYKPLPASLPYFEGLLKQSGTVVKLEEVTNLPPLIKSPRYVDLHQDIARHYREIEKQFCTYFKSIDGDDAVVADLVLTQRLRMQQICNGILKGASGEETIVETDKNSLLMETLESIGVPQKKVIIWANFRPALERIRQICKAMNLYYCEFVGGQTPEERALQEKRFREEDKYSVAIASQHAASEGANLQAASYMIYYSKDYNLKHDLQSSKRNYRRGSEIHSCIVRIDFLTRGTIEEVIHEALDHKYDMASFNNKLKERYGK